MTKRLIMVLLVIAGVVFVPYWVGVNLGRTLTWWPIERSNPTGILWLVGLWILLVFSLGLYLIYLGIKYIIKG
jgi:hypothetical protein